MQSHWFDPFNGYAFHGITMECISYGSSEMENFLNMLIENHFIFLSATHGWGDKKKLHKNWN